MKYCPKCGAQVNDDAAYCPKCGAKLIETETIKAEVVNDNESQNSQKAENNDGSTLSSSPESKESTAKVLGILALVFGIFGGFLGLVFGIIGLVTDKEKTLHWLRYCRNCLIWHVGYRLDRRFRKAILIIKSGDILWHFALIVVAHYPKEQKVAQNAVSQLKKLLCLLL